MNSQFDDQFAEIAMRCGDLGPLFDSFFGFLSRRTDFYQTFNDKTVPHDRGFPEGQAEKILLQSFRKYPFIEIKNEQKLNSITDTPTATVKPIESKSGFSSTDYQTSDGKLIPIGNGGYGLNYYWTQNLKELTVYIDVPEGTRAKDISCVIRPTTLKITLKNTPPSTPSILEGEFEYSIKTEESMWTLNLPSSSSPSSSSSSFELPQIVLTLDKVQHTWWKHILKGEPEIDTTKVDSTRRIGEYDEETQSTIHRLMTQHREKMVLESSSSSSSSSSLSSLTSSSPSFSTSPFSNLSSSSPSLPPPPPSLPPTSLPSSLS